MTSPLLRPEESADTVDRVAPIRSHRNASGPIGTDRNRKLERKSRNPAKKMAAPMFFIARLVGVQTFFVKTQASSNPLLYRPEQFPYCVISALKIPYIPVTFRKITPSPRVCA
jgi:hypothetical protein